MKLYSAPDPAPNPRRVRIFLAEKGLSIPEVMLDLRKREQKDPAFREKNPSGQVPVLELDDGRVLCETVSICRYLDALHPHPPLFGSEPFATAQIDMWIRRVEFIMMSPVSMVWRHAHPMTAALLSQHRDFGESNREIFQASALWFDRQLNDRPFVAGADFTMADVCLLTTLEFADFIGLKTPDAAERLKAWRKRVSDRPSVSA